VADPEAHAAEILAELPSWLWDGRSLPVPVEDIADSHFGLRVCESDDLAAVAGAPPPADGGELSGLLIVEAREVWINASEAREWPGRRRFTIGHEVGHWVLHRPLRGKVFCRSSAVSLDEPRERRPDIEEEASLFSGALLFPEALVRAQHEALDGDLAALCERFGASRAATERAIFRAVRRPRVPETLRCFFWDDDGYDAWREAHAGFVVNDNLGDFTLGRLHRSDCSYLARPVQGAPRTRQPKWCSEDLDALRGAFPEVSACARCAPRL
jgi:uncharacterized protein DUF955